MPGPTTTTIPYPHPKTNAALIRTFYASPQKMKPTTPMLALTLALTATVFALPAPKPQPKH